MNELNFKGGNPGAVKYGNFINYYEFHPPEERIRLLPKNIWPSPKGLCTALDIGCNAGNLSVSLVQFLKENVNQDPSMLAVDIDPTLIERAQQLEANITFLHLDIMDETGREQAIKNYLSEREVTRFSIVFCFSTTMWIHLNHGDAGLHTLLKYISSITELLVIEPQPWKCYKTALKRMRQKNASFPYFSALKMRSNVEQDIENVLVHDCAMEKLVESEKNVWERKLFVFRHKERTLE